MEWLVVLDILFIIALTIIMASRRQSLLSGPFSFSGALSERSFNNNNQSPL